MWEARTDVPGSSYWFPKSLMSVLVYVDLLVRQRVEVVA